MCESSVDSAFRNFFRAGVLKKRSRTVIEVPAGRPASSTRAIFPPLISMTVPAGSSAARVSSRKRDTEAIDGRASPRNPSVATLKKIFGILNLGSCMPLKGQHGVVSHHSAAVIDDLYELLPARLDTDFDPRGAGIKRVLQHFFHDRCGPFYHLASGDLVGNGFGKYVDAAHVVSVISG